MLPVDEEVEHGMTMIRIKEVLRMRMGKGQPVRDVARSMGVSLGAVSGMVARAKEAGLGWPELEQMDDDALESSVAGLDRQPNRTMPVCAQYTHLQWANSTRSSIPGLPLFCPWCNMPFRNGLNARKT
jgi:hypothetical protein